MGSSIPGGSQFNGAFDCFRKTLKAEGFRGLYKGVTSPMAGVAAVNAVVFSSYGSSLRWLGGRMDDENDTDDELQLSIWKHSLAGGVAGLINCVVISPVELLKARMQVMPPSPPLYTRTFACTHSAARVVVFARTRPLRP